MGHGTDGMDGVLFFPMKMATACGLVSGEFDPEIGQFEYVVTYPTDDSGWGLKIMTFVAEVTLC